MSFGRDPTGVVDEKEHRKMRYQFSLGLQLRDRYPLTNKVVRKNPLPPGGVSSSLLGGFQTKDPEEEETPEEQLPKLYLGE